MSSAPGPSDTARALARTAGLRDRQLPRLADVDRRRAQLWGLSLLVAVVVPAVVVVAGTELWQGLVDDGPLRDVLSRRNVQLGLAGVLVTVMGYVAEREVSLRRLTALLLEEQALTRSLVDRVEELNILIRATRAMNSALHLDVVLDQIADSALTLLDARGVTILLVDADHDDRLVVAATAGASDGVVGGTHRLSAGLVATDPGRRRSRRAGLLGCAGGIGGRDAGDGRTLVVPLEVRGALVGVITVQADEDRRPFTELDQRSMDVFGDAAAGAITNAKAHGQQLDNVSRLLEESRARDEFLTLVTHELRTPLTSMIGLMATMAKRGDMMVPEQIVECAEIARGQGWRLDQLIENLLDSSRMVQGGLVVAPRAVDVGAEVRDMAEDLGRALPTHPISVTVPEGVQRMVDTDAVRRILDNLLGNCAKFCPNGTEVHIGLRTTDTGVALSVSDGGAGLVGFEVETVMERFGRGPDPYDRGGLGLGLYVVQALAEAHGGRVDVDTVPGRGTTVTVTLRAAPVVTAAD